MTDESRRAAADAMRAINQAWLEGRLADLEERAHPEIVTVFPGFSGSVQGRDAFMEGFRDFCQNATIHEFQEQDFRVDVMGATAVATFRYQMVYERSAARYRASGRDMWVFENADSGWIAVWRAMLDMDEVPA